MSRAGAGILSVLGAGLLAASCGGGGYSGGSTMPTSATATSATSTAADVVVTIAGMSFSPNAVTVKDGQTIAWQNSDSVAHTATQDGGGFDTGTIAAGATSKPITISGSGALHYHCSFHAGMVGVINVGATGTGY